MTTPTPIGFGNLTNIAQTNLTFNFPNNSSGWITKIIDTANQTPYLNFIVLFSWFLLTFWVLGDKNPSSKFRYETPRALNISIGVTAIVGITMIEANFFYNLIVVGLFIGMFVMSYIWIIIYE